MKPKSTLRSFLFLAGSSLLAISSASAADGTWDTDAAGNWTDIANWLGDAAYASGINSTATLGNFISLDRTITLDAPITIGNITASDADKNYTISGSGANILTLDRSSGIPTINVTTSTRTLTISSEIAGLDGLQKSGLGTLSLSGANTYTGTTTITSGILQLNFSATGAPTSNIISNSSVLSLGGGQLTVTGKASTTTSQTFASTSVTGGANTITNTANATANPQLVALGAITRSAGATLNFSLPTGTQAASNGITTTNTTTNGIIGGWATVANASWAGKTGDNITSGSVTYTTTATAGTTAANYTDNNIDVTSSAGLIDNVITPNSLRFNTLGAFTMTLAAGDNIIGSGGILVGTTVGTNISTITGGNLAGSASGELIIHQNNATGLTIGSIIKNNGGATGLTKSGTGLLTLNGDNSYTGTTTINSGSLSIAHNNALGTTAGNTIFGPGSVQLLLQKNITDLSIGINSPENITFFNSGTVIYNNSQKSSTLSGDITLDNPSGNIAFSTANGGSYIVFSGTISQTGTSRDLILSTPGNGTGGQGITVNKPIANNGGRLVISGAGKSLLKGANASATDGIGIGETVISAASTVAQLILGVSNALNTTANLTIGSTVVGTDRGKLDLAGFNQTVNALIGNGTEATNSTRTVTNSATGTGTNALTVGNGGGSGTFNGLITDGTTAKIELIKTDVGTQTLTGANTYTGTTAVNGGTLVITGATQATSAITFGGGVLGLDTASSVTAASATIDFTGQQVLVTGTTGSPSYTLLTASSITGTSPTLAPGSVSGYTLQVSGNQLLLVQSGGITFADWKTANGAGLQTLADDHDGDGVDNGTEYFLFGNAVSTGFNALPGVTNTLGTLSVTWTKAASYAGTYGTDFRVETSDTLTGTWTQEDVPPTPGATVTISGNNVTYTFPGGPAYSGKKFARLKVTGP